MEEDNNHIIGVYRISNVLSGRYYIGYSTNINRRFCVHRSKLKQNCHDNKFLQRAYNLEGEDKFQYDIIHICDTEDEAKEIEIHYALLDIILGGKKLVGDKRRMIDGVDVAINLYQRFNSIDILFFTGCIVDNSNDPTNFKNKFEKFIFTRQ